MIRKPTASGLERAMKCSASMGLPVVNSTSPAADRGIWRHAFLARVGQIGAEQALAEVPAEHQDACAALPLDELPVDLSAEVAFAFDVSSYKARVIGQGVDRDYGKLAPFELAGTADVVGLSAGQALILDWKSQGFRGHARDSLQLRFLAVCASQAYGVGSVRVEIVRLGDTGEVSRSWHVYDELDLGAFASELRDWFTRAKADDVPHEGRWCSNCPSWTACPAKTSLLVLAAGGGDLAAPFMNGLSRSTVGSAFVLAENLKSLARELDKRIAAAVEQFGECETPRGTVLRKSLVEGNERLAGSVVHAVVAERFGRDVADAAVEMSATKTRLGTALKAAGLKVGPSSSEVLDEVRRRGGASRSTSERLVETDPKELRRAG